MARPRTPSNILELHGAFRKDPQRRRKDAEGSAPFEIDPPTHLAKSVVPAWHYIVARLPKIALANCDEVAVECAATCLAGMWALGEMAALHPNFGKLSAELRQWLGQLGMTPQARTKIAAVAEKPAGNPFAE